MREHVEIFFVALNFFYIVQAGHHQGARNYVTPGDSAETGVVNNKCLKLTEEGVRSRWGWEGLTHEIHEI